MQGKEKTKNIQIPIELFNAVLNVMEYIDISNYTADFQDIFNSVLGDLQEKKNKMDLREDYQRLIKANKSGNEDKQYEARIQYLQNRRK